LKQPHLLSPAEIARATELWNGGATLDQLCAELRINRDILIARRAPGDQLEHLARRRAGQRLRGPRAPAPTPDEIRQRAAAVRATWSETERLNRIAAPGANVGFEGERFGGRHVPSKFNRRTW
jgi:hypothetical protein